QPPLLNSSCAWSSDFQQLTELYESPYTGAITTRTTTLRGFKENDSHTVAFHVEGFTTINSYGYSPHPLSDYLTCITASDSQVLSTMVNDIQAYGTIQIAIELNNLARIFHNPPSGYSFRSLFHYSMSGAARSQDPTLTIGLKLPHILTKITPGADGDKCPFAFLACTNTLGNSLLFADQTIKDTSVDTVEFGVPTALGGLAGEALHPLALGNVYTFKQLLSSKAQNLKLTEIKLSESERMKKAGADVIGCATLLGKEGVYAFEILGKD
ncbi:hypothetical protein CPB84DRAFT_1759826, partial [Gymnopilus junonius]